MIRRAKALRRQLHRRRSLPRGCDWMRTNGTGAPFADHRAAWLPQRELDDVVILPNHRRVHIRALRRDGGCPHPRALRGLEPAHAIPPVLPSTVPDSVIRQLARVDYRHQLALVAEPRDRECPRNRRPGKLRRRRRHERGGGARRPRRLAATARRHGARQPSASGGRAARISPIHRSSAAGQRRELRKLLRSVGEVVVVKAGRWNVRVAFVRRVSSELSLRSVRSQIPPGNANAPSLVPRL